MSEKTKISRRTELEKIQRFGTIPHMCYRTSLASHYRRINVMIQSIAPDARKFFPEFEPNLACTIANVHDDVEIITGDIPTHKKEAMSAHEAKLFQLKEQFAMQILSERFVESRYKQAYIRLLLLAQSKATLESQIVSLIDKIDAFGESVQEVYAGNHYFIAVADSYVRRINELPKALPLLTEYLKQTAHPLLQPIPPINFLEAFKRRTPGSTGITVFDAWRRITQNNK